MEKRKSSFLDKTPVVGSIVVFNPPRYKGLVVGYVIGFMPQSGLPKVVHSYNYSNLKEKYKDLFHLNDDTGLVGFVGDEDKLYYDTPKTGFEIVGNIFIDE